MLFSKQKFHSNRQKLKNWGTMLFRAVLLLFLTCQVVYPQTLTIKGKIEDARTQFGLPFANLRIANSSSGTAANSIGEFELRVQSGEYKIIASYIGYDSDTLKLFVKNNIELTIKLKPSSVEMKEVTVTPGRNPALDIIEKAIESKHKRNNDLKSYSFSAYTKGLIKTTKDISSNGNNVGVSIGEPDSAKLKITGIIENESRGYFQKPGNYKEEIIAQKQSSNFSSQINVLTGGRIIQDFYGNDIEFFGRPLPGPLADNALDYYYYYIENTVAFDGKKVYQIYFAPEDDYYPGFWGRIYISDSTYNLIKVDVNLNRAANPGRIFTKVNIFQQFYPYDGIYMPVDYRLFVEGNVLGLAKFGFEVNSILYDFKINPEFDEDFFGMLVLKVLPQADQKDSTYWNKIQTIPSTMEETKAYERIDSLESVPVTFWDRFSFLSGRIPMGENFSITGPLALYNFNKVEGHALDFGFYTFNLFNKRLNASAEFNYGFSDKKFKKELSARYLLGDYRTSRISFTAFDKLQKLFGESDSYNQLTSTVLSLFTKYDFRNYYYSKGFKFNFEGEVFPILRLGIGMLNRTDNSAINNSDFSFFFKDRKYNPNMRVFETKVNALKANFVIDFRKFIEDGYYRRRVSQGKSFVLLKGDAIISSSNILNSNSDFKLFKLNLNGTLNTFKSASLNFDINSIFGQGAVPFQMLHALPGNINAAAKNFSFRTLRIGEVFGDKIWSLNLEHEFNDELFIMSGLPLIKDLQLMLNVHAGAAWVDLSKESLKILPIDYRAFNKPLIEAGFSIGQILMPISFDFTWKVTHRGKNNFVFGINTLLL